jgi:hypothetical protein
MSGFNLSQFEGSGIPMKNHGFKTMVFHRHIFPMKNHGFGEIPGPSNWLKLKPAYHES